MSIAYVIFGFEWSTNEQGAAPEICKYQVAKVFYGEHDYLPMLVNSEFVTWKQLARNEVWRQVVQTTVLNDMPIETIEWLIKTFDKASTAQWYYLSEDEYNEWVEWADGDGADEVTITEIKSEYC